MASAKKCDRCGKYYDANIFHNPRSVEQDYRHIGGVKTSVVEGMWTDESFDLCDYCIDDFYNFINEFKEKENG